jgi:hypothetical protein
MFSSEKVLHMSYANYQCVPFSLSPILTDSRPFTPFPLHLSTPPPKKTTTFNRGKEALVEKFKNSCIMDEREAWRPKIFYSEPGAMQGLPEPFPPPTHWRRKERSACNRGALFVGAGGNGCVFSRFFLGFGGWC